MRIADGVPARGLWEREIIAATSYRTGQDDDGRIYVTQTQAEGHYVIRFQVGQTHTSEEDVALAFEVITELARGL